MSIDEAIREEALDRNLDLLAERFNLSVADTKMITARLRPNPVVSIGGDHLDLLGTGYNTDNQAGPSEYSLRTDSSSNGEGSARAASRWRRTASVVELQFMNTVRTLTLDVENSFV